MAAVLEIEQPLPNFDETFHGAYDAAHARAAEDATAMPGVPATFLEQRAEAERCAAMRLEGQRITEVHNALVARHNALIHEMIELRVRDGVLSNAVSNLLMTMDIDVGFDLQDCVHDEADVNVVVSASISPTDDRRLEWTLRLLASFFDTRGEDHDELIERSVYEETYTYADGVESPGTPWKFVPYLAEQSAAKVLRTLVRFKGVTVQQIRDGDYVVDGGAA